MAFNIFSIDRIKVIELLSYFIIMFLVLFLSWRYGVYTCANTLREVYCSTLHHIHIENVWSDRKCGGIVGTNAIGRLRNLCDGECKCSPDTDRDSSLYYQRFVSLSYGCTGKHDLVFVFNKHLINCNVNHD